MGKLYNSLYSQLQTENKEDAEKCIKIYNKLLEIQGSVWSSAWTPLVYIQHVGKYPYTKIYKPTKIGEIFLKGLN